jgi:hypothetical protein
VLECRFECVFAYGSNRSGWKAMHEKKSWRDLAVSVLKVGYKSDLSYFLLGEAASGLGLRDAAHAYHTRAITAEKEGYGCGGFPDSCEGIDVKRLSLEALRR